MMQDFKIAVVQMNAKFGQSDCNLALHETFIKKAGAKRCDLVLFPELSITGHWTDNAATGEAEPVPHGKRCGFIASLAKSYNIYIGAGIAEFCNGAVYNSYVIFSPEGYVGHQRKVHPAGDEYYYYRAGSEFSVFELPFCKIGINICFDTMFPESARVLALKGADLIAAPHAARWHETPKNDKDERALVRKLKAEALKLSSVRANDNRCFYVYCNQAGVAGKIKKKDIFHAGGVLILDPCGQLIDESRTRIVRPDIVFASLKKKQLLKARSVPCAPLTARRPSAYKIIADESI